MNDRDDGDDAPATEAEMSEARQRHAAERPMLAGTELFARPVYGDGVRGDVAIGADDGLPEGVEEGDIVTAKRLGWDDEDEDESPDSTPYDEMDYDSPDLSGELTAIRFTLPDGSESVGWEVGGQPADPKTVRAKSP